MGLELDPVAADAKESDGYRRYALLYKEWRQLIHTGVLWRVDMPDPSIQVQESSALISLRHFYDQPACNAGLHLTGHTSFSRSGGGSALPASGY